ncbi:hypothetical protein [Tsukamurella sp. NPDC003166]|uniref:hypothetical protein n=1 Tax=Tsukamurella sp. NPDC003166 TaxID=3154444 RepID=UPI0033B49127
MEAGDDLAEAEIRYQMLAEVFTDSPQLRANLAPALERTKAEILRLRAAAKPVPSTTGDGKVVPFDGARFQKMGSA